MQMFGWLVPLLSDLICNIFSFSFLDKRSDKSNVRGQVWGSCQAQGKVSYPCLSLFLSFFFCFIKLILWLICCFSSAGVLRTTGTRINSWLMWPPQMWRYITSTILSCSLCHLLGFKPNMYEFLYLFSIFIYCDLYHLPPSIFLSLLRVI